MISYNPKDWISFIFRFHKSDTFRKMGPLILLICVYSWVIAYLEIEYFHISDKSYLRNIPVMHNLLGFAISMLLVFRTNTAYDRWWEGRKLWGGLVNNSRNLSLKLAAYLPAGDEQRNFFRKIIPAYAFSLHKHLNAEKTRTALFDNGAHDHIMNQVDQQKHVPNQIATLMFRHIQQLYTEQKIDGHQLITLNAELQAFSDICGACERIKNTPIPYSYSAFLKKFIFFYIITLPVGYVFSLSYYVIPVVAFIFYVLGSLELIAEEIEDPFGKDQNDLPTEKIAQKIHNDVLEIL